MSIPDSDQYVFLVITWGEDEREVFGPYVAQEDGSHLEQITDRVEQWRAEHPDRPNMAVHLFATRAVPEGDAPEREIAPELIAALAELGDTYGPLGVALSAATLTDVAILREHLEPGYAPTVAEGDTPDLETVP